MTNHPNRRRGYGKRRALLITIPEGLPFSALRLSRESNGDVSFDTAVVRQICEASGLDQEQILDDGEDAVSGLIVAWYGVHRRDGGPPDPVADDLIAEALAEGERGSHKPGTA